MSTPTVCSAYQLGEEKFTQTPTENIEKPRFQSQSLTCIFKPIFSRV